MQSAYVVDHINVCVSIRGFVGMRWWAASANEFSTIFCVIILVSSSVFVDVVHARAFSPAVGEMLVMLR